MKAPQRSRIYAAVIAGLLASSYGMTSIPTALAAEQTVEKKTRILAGQTYTFIKTIDAKGEVRSEILDGSGKLVGEKDVPRGVAPLVDPRVLEALTRLERSQSSQTLRVEIALNLPTDTSEEILETGAGQVEKGLWKTGFLNGKAISEQDMMAYADQYALAERAARTKRTAVRVRDLQDWASRYGLPKSARPAPTSTLVALPSPAPAKPRPTRRLSPPT